MSRSIDIGDRGEKPPERTEQCCWRFLDACGPFELSCMLLSVIALVTIILTLRMFDGRQQSHWIVSLNTTVSFLTIFAKFSIVGLLGSGIGQLKWIWYFDLPRNLKDVAIFDSASRGEVVANCKLPLLQKFRTVATLGCVAFLLGVGFEPFTQNLISYRTEQILDFSKIARVANSSIYQATGPLLTTLNETIPYSVDLAFKSNVYSSVFSRDPGRPWSVPKYTCGSGNCTWPVTETLGVRALCSDLTPLIYRDCDSQYCGARIDGGPELYFLTREQYAGVLVINVTTTPVGIVYTNATLPVVQYIMVKGGGSAGGDPSSLGTHQPLVATECSLELCIQTSTSSDSNSVYYEDDFDYYCRSSVPRWNSSLTVKPRRHLTLNKYLGRRQFQLSHPAWQSIVWFLQNIFDSSLYADKSNTWYVLSSVKSLYAPVDIGQSIFYGNYSQCEGIEDHLTCVAHNVAAAMTKSFRDSAYITYGVENADMAVGKTMTFTTIVRIDWAWLSLPLLIWTMSIILWMSTALQSIKRGLPLWRNNPMSLLYLLREEANVLGEPPPRFTTPQNMDENGHIVQLYITPHDAYIAQR